MGAALHTRLIPIRAYISVTEGVTRLLFKSNKGMKGNKKKSHVDDEKNWPLTLG
jgi:hypothetical protein